MIQAVNTTQTQSRYGRRQIVRDSGYTAIAAGTVCGITGLKKVKLPHKMTVHKTSAYIAAITSFLHLGAIKGWDKKFYGKINLWKRTKDN